MINDRESVSDVIIRRARSDEIPDLIKIWKPAFGSGDDKIFYRHFFDPELCVVAVYKNTPAAAGYILPVGTYTSHEFTLPCGMIYAVAALPEYRNRGLGSAVVRELISTGFIKGYDVIVLSPSSDGLFEFYSARSCLRDWFYVCEQKFNSLPVSDQTVPLAVCSPEEYALVREGLLSDIPHIALDNKALTYQHLLCGFYGGGFYRTGSLSGSACAVVEKQEDGSVWVKELLTKDIRKADIISSIAAMYPADEYLVRSPSPACETDAVTRRFGMLTVSPGKTGFSFANYAKPYYGLAFD